jgi:NADH:ubiquinone oxidoreductase subunit F (NADH-binding)/NADH:ubiquinone oxidoreductase subunit E
MIAPDAIVTMPAIFPHTGSPPEIENCSADRTFNSFFEGSRPSPFQKAVLGPKITTPVLLCDFCLDTERRRRRSMIILRELQRIQDDCGWLPEERLEALAERINTPLHRLHQVASFYPSFNLAPPPKVDVKVCRDISCHIRGAPEYLEHLKSVSTQFGDAVQVGGVSCLGQCDRGPAVSINHSVYRGLTARQVAKGIRQAARGDTLPSQQVDLTPLGCKIDLYEGKPTYEVVRRILGKAESETLSADALLEKLKTANLVGMGGAGFPTHLKWAAVRKESTLPKYIVCNADESEPGTFKDREILRRAPYLVLEGMILAALVTGANKGYIYIRHEYEAEIAAIEKAIKKAELDGICGENILGSGISFPLETFISPGGYIQGEESALLEAMEDRRGEPRNKPPFPTQFGLFNKPTVINNVETLSWVPSIALKGGEWYRDAGVNGATGMRLVSISGDVYRPGVYEVPFGQTVRELVCDTAGGMRDRQQLKAIASSGPSGGFLPAFIRREHLSKPFVERMVNQGRMAADAKAFDILNLPLDNATLKSLDNMLGAAFVAIGDRTNMVELALNCTQFYRNESCGKCVPCRMGSQKLTEMITALLGGKLPRQQLGVIQELRDTMYQTSICGLGMVVANPIGTVMKYFPEEIERYLAGQR